MKCHQKPLQSDPDLVQAISTFRNKIQIQQDLGFVGTMTPQRQELIQGLQEAGIKVYWIQSFDVDTQIQEMMKCKAVLNLHASPEYIVFESARCNMQLDAGMPVITEPSLDDDPRCIVFQRHSFVTDVQDWIRK